MRTLGTIKKTYREWWAIRKDGKRDLKEFVMSERLDGYNDVVYDRWFIQILDYSRRLFLRGGGVFHIDTFFITWYQFPH